MNGRLTNEVCRRFTGPGGGRGWRRGRGDNGRPPDAPADRRPEAAAADAGPGGRGGGHHEDQRGEGAGEGLQTVGIGRQGGCTTTGGVAVRAASGKTQKEVLVAESEDDDNNGSHRPCNLNHHCYEIHAGRPAHRPRDAGGRPTGPARRSVRGPGSTGQDAGWTIIGRREEEEEESGRRWNYRLSARTLK